MHRLTARQLNLASAAAVLTLGLVWVDLWHSAPSAQLLRTEALNLTCSLCVPIRAA
jgi:hypothetical protein